MEKQNEIRFLDLNLAIREVEGHEGESRVITGTAIVFNKESVLMDNYGTKFREIISPETAPLDWLMTQDIKLNIMHDRKDTVGRCNKGVGNMTVSVDDEGVHFEAEMPRCDLGDRALEMVRSGVYTGCSFEFIPDKYDVEERMGKEPLLIQRRFRKLSAFTLGMDPAYIQTSVSVREITHTGEDENHDDDHLRREREISDSMRLARERDFEFYDINN